MHKLLTVPAFHIQQHHPSLSNDHYIALHHNTILVKVLHFSEQTHTLCTEVCEVSQCVVRCSCIHHLPFVHQRQVVELFEDGVAWLVDGEDHSLTSPGQPGHKVFILTRSTT